MLVLCEEFACGFQLVAHYAEEFLAFLKDVQVDERCFVVGCARPPLHTVNVCFAQGGELFFAEFGLLEHSFFVVETASGEHLASLVHQIADAVADGPELFHKGRRYGVEVVVDGEDMDIELYTVNDDAINKDSLSKGEQQLYATSILKALVDESGIQFPVFIDSPLQKFDKSHATKIITEFYPQISKQVVLFPLLYKELTSDEYEVMKPLVNATYLIQNKVTHSSFKQVPIDEFINKE